MSYFSLEYKRETEEKLLLHRLGLCRCCPALSPPSLVPRNSSLFLWMSKQTRVAVELGRGGWWSLPRASESKLGSHPRPLTSQPAASLTHTPTQSWGAHGCFACPSPQLVSTLGSAPSSQKRLQPPHMAIGKLKKKKKSLIQSQKLVSLRSAAFLSACESLTFSTSLPAPACE